MYTLLSKLLNSPEGYYWNFSRKIIEKGERKYDKSILYILEGVDMDSKVPILLDVPKGGKLTIYEEFYLCRRYVVAAGCADFRKFMSSKELPDFLTKIRKIVDKQIRSDNLFITTPNGNRRESISDEVKIFVWQRDQGQCVKCCSKENLEYDHIIPHSMGGGNSERNIQLLCQGCNRNKGATL